MEESKIFLFQYRACGQELMVNISASNLNQALIKFATHYHNIEEVYEIALTETQINN